MRVMLCAGKEAWPRRVEGFSDAAFSMLLGCDAFLEMQRPESRTWAIR